MKKIPPIYRFLAFLISPLFFTALPAIFGPGQASADWSVDLETGAVLSGYNDLRIPGDTGTDLSLSEELDTDPSHFFRVRVGKRFARRHTVSALFAPLSLTAEGSVPREVNFSGATFPAGADLRAGYRFDSYRLTYRYDFLLSERWEIGAGFTVKIRDAGISLDGPVFAEKTNTGFVPIIHFRVRYLLADEWSALLEGDALAAPQGRAEDVLAAICYGFNEYVQAKAGYRILEGGADNDEVYTFTLLHYFVIGLITTF